MKYEYNFSEGTRGRVRKPKKPKSLVDKWKLVLDKRSVHPKVREEAAQKLEKLFNSCKNNDGDYNPGGFTKKLKQVLHQYDRRDNNVK